MSLFNVTPAGLVTVDSSEIRKEFEEAYKQALGGEISTDSGTIEGYLIDNDTKFLTYAQQESANIANSFSVLTAKGRALDVVAGLWGYYRKAGEKTVVNAVLTGSSGTVVRAGSVASAGGVNYVLLDTVTIGTAGTVSAQFQCVESGAITCAPSALNEIITTTKGWDAITNNQAGLVGYDEETDEQFRARITANWLNIRSTGTLGAIMDSVAQINGVLSALVRENMSNNEITIDNVVLSPHSIYLAVVGGKAEDIARTLYNKKTSGAGTNGGTTISYTDPSNGVVQNYQIKRADILPVHIKIIYSNNYYTPVDVNEKIKSTLINYISGGLSIGQTISGNMLSLAFENFEYANILSIKLSLDGQAWNDYISATIEQMPDVAPENILVEEA